MVTLQQMKNALKAVLNSTDIKIKNVKEPLTDQIADTKDLLTKRINNIPQSSWTQNDETAKDFIQGRTHYEYETYKKILDIRTTETEVTPSLSDGRYQFSVAVGNESTNNFPRSGAIYLIIFNGVEYVRNCVRSNMSTYDGSIGNENVYDSSRLDTGEPFFINRGTYGVAKAYVRGPEPVTIQVYEVQYQMGCKQLDEKYIPDTIARKSDIPDSIESDGGIYVGSGEAPEQYNVQIDPEGEAIDLVTREEFDQLSEQINDLKENGSSGGSGATSMGKFIGTVTIDNDETRKVEWTQCEDGSPLDFDELYIKVEGMADARRNVCFTTNNQFSSSAYNWSLEIPHSLEGDTKMYITAHCRMIGGVWINVGHARANNVYGTGVNRSYTGDIGNGTERCTTSLVVGLGWGHFMNGTVITVYGR